MTETAKRIRVLIVDDHQVVRQGLRTFLDLHEDIQVVGEAGDGESAVEMARKLAPDVVLMDLVMPGVDGIAATARIKALGLGAKVIALTSFTDDDKIFPVIQAGASSYLLKDVSPDMLVEAIREWARPLRPASITTSIARSLSRKMISKELKKGCARSSRRITRTSAFTFPRKKERSSSRRWASS